MIPPTSIDGTDITGATIDGTDVEEITVDGDTVFSAGPSIFPVAYSNLVGWYPFDSATYGGSNADDVTALFNPGQSGDSTPYDGTVNGATYQSSGGGTDINTGPNSGAFNFDGNNDNIDFGSIPNVENVSQMTAMCWVNMDDSGGFKAIFGSYPNDNDNMFLGLSGGSFAAFIERNNNGFGIFGNTAPVGTWQHIAFTFDSGSLILYQDGLQTASGSGVSTTPSNGQEWYAGYRASGGGDYTDCQIDDCRVYDTALSASQISQIVSNTPH